MFSKLIKFSFNNLRARKLRSWLTVIGVIIGVASVIGLLLLGQGLRNAVTDQMQKAGANKIMVTPGGGGNFGIMSASELTEHDLELIKDVRGVEKAGGMMFKMAGVEYRNERKYNYVIGISPEISISDMMGIDVETGKELQKGGSGEVLIGYRLLYQDMFDRAVRVGSTITIQDKEFKVIGGLSKIGNPQDDSQLYISLSDAQDLFSTEGFSYIMVKTKVDIDPEIVAVDIKEKLRKDRGQKKGDEDFSVQTFEQLMNTFDTILQIVNIAVMGIAAISLIVGGIGIMNTMYTSVIERTKQIGVMKAVGAKDKHILLLFVLESGIIGLIGGILGLILGYSFAKIIEFGAQLAGFSMLRIQLTPLIALIGLFFAFLMGIVSGYLPARQAAKLNPIEALRWG